MWILEVCDTSIKYLNAEKGYLGNLSLKSANKIDVSAQEWENKLPLEIRNKEIFFIIPDSKVFLNRLQIPAGFVEPALRSTILSKINELIPLSLNDLIYDYTVLHTDIKSNIQEILFVAIKSEILANYFKAFHKMNARPVLIIPESLAVYNVIKEALKGNDALLYIDMESSYSMLSFFDRYGPFSTFYEPVETQKLEQETKKVLEYFKNKYSKEVSSIVIGGQESINANLDEFSKTVNLPVGSAINILSEEVKKQKIKVDTGNTAQMYFLNTISTGLMLSQNHAINFAKKDLTVNILLSDKKNTEDSKKDNKSELAKKGYFNKSLNSADIHTLDKPGRTRTIILLFILIILVSSLYITLSNKKLTAKNPVKEAVKKIEKSVGRDKKISAPSPTAVNKISPSALDKKILKIQVLNGAGTKGVAGVMKEFLTGKGYENIDAANAQNSQYSKISIQIKEERKEYLEPLINDLKKDYEIGKTGQDLAKSSKYDVIIIVGK